LKSTYQKWRQILDSFLIDVERLLPTTEWSCNSYRSCLGASIPPRLRAPVGARRRNSLTHACRLLGNPWTCREPRVFVRSAKGSGVAVYYTAGSVHCLHFKMQHSTLCCWIAFSPPSGQPKRERERDCEPGNHHDTWPTASPLSLQVELALCYKVVRALTVFKRV
jgi:hypothetical protein